jgi:hypothetical protein
MAMVIRLCSMKLERGAAHGCAKARKYEDKE